MHSLLGAASDLVYVGLLATAVAASAGVRGATKVWLVLLLFFPLVAPILTGRSMLPLARATLLGAIVISTGLVVHSFLVARPSDRSMDGAT
jgi:hypothetical protein